MKTSLARHTCLMATLITTLLYTPVPSLQSADASYREQDLTVATKSTMRIRNESDGHAVIGGDRLEITVERTTKFRDRQSIHESEPAKQIRRTIRSACVESTAKWSYPERLQMPPGQAVVRGESPLVEREILMEWDDAKGAYSSRRNADALFEFHASTALAVPAFPEFESAAALAKGESLDLDISTIARLLAPLGNPSIKLDACDFSLEDPFVGRIGLIGALGVGAGWPGAAECKGDGKMVITDAVGTEGDGRRVFLVAIGVSGTAHADLPKWCSVTGITFSDYATKDGVVETVNTDWTMDFEGRLVWNVAERRLESYRLEGKQLARVSASVRVEKGRVDRASASLEGNVVAEVQFTRTKQ